MRMLECKSFEALVDRERQFDHGKERRAGNSFIRETKDSLRPDSSLTITINDCLANLSVVAV